MGILRILREWIVGTLGFSKSEANGTIFMILGIIAFYFLPKVIMLHLQAGYPQLDPLAPTWMAKWKQAVTQEVTLDQTNELKIFAFDPNSVSLDEWVKLGFSEKSGQNLIKYREHGGKFYTSADLLKIYGVDKKLIKALQEHIVYPSQKEIKKVAVYKRKPNTYPKTKTKEILPWEINSVTADQLTAVKGIGSKLSQRIISYRNKLGGFHSLSQLHEVYGLDSTTVQQVAKHSQLEISKIQKINIYSDSLKHFYQHPYISYKLAKTISAYVRQHQPQSIADLSNIKILSDSLFQKLSPYLSLPEQSPE